MNRKSILAVFVAILSIGWLVPLWLGVSTYLTFWEIEAWPLIAGDKPGNSFPFISFARDCFMWAFLWLAAVLAFWFYLGFQALNNRSAA